MENKSLLEAQVKIGSVLQRSTPAFKSLIGKKLDKFLVTIDKEIADHLEDIGKLIVETIKTAMYESTGTGRTYTYVEDGEVIATEKASAENMAPGVFQQNLINSLEYKVERWKGTVRIGVYNSGVGTQYGTIAYYGRYYMKFNGKYQFVPNVVIVDSDGHKTPIKEYAQKLEEEQNRPFIRNTIENKSQEFRQDLYKELRENLSALFKGKKPPVYFRLYIK